MADEQTPLLNTTAAGGEQTADEVPEFVPASTLTYYWCVTLAPSLALCNRLFGKLHDANIIISL